MVTPENSVQTCGNEVRTATTWYGLSTDAKPENPANGDRLILMDTSKLLIYSADDETWYEWSA